MYNDHSDYRFLKDIVSYRIPKCICCLYQQGLRLTFDAKDDSDEERLAMKPRIACASKEDVAATHVLTVKHPGLSKDLQDQIKDSWSKARLVSD